MGSSSKHRTNMSKSSNTQPDFHTSGHKSAAFPSVLANGSGKRTLEPKPRWNPRPEQIRILESIFNAGMVNPTRQEISNIRAQLQEFGQVADSYIFYWFQNKKSRSKLKNCQQNSARSKAIVDINGVKFKVCSIHPFCVQEVFGKDAVLFHPCGNPVPTNNWGATLHPLKHGASYILKYFPSAAAPNQFPIN